MQELNGKTCPNKVSYAVILLLTAIVYPYIIEVPAEKQTLLLFVTEPLAVFVNWPQHDFDPTQSASAVQILPNVIVPALGEGAVMGLPTEVAVGVIVVAVGVEVAGQDLIGKAYP